MPVEDIVIRMNVEGEEEIEQALKVAGISMRQFNKHLQGNIQTLTKQGIVVDRLTGKEIRLSDAMRKAAISSRRFKFEWLGIMFAGMALSRVFGGLIRQQMELFGVSDMLAAMWTVVMLPIMELITPIIYKLIEAMMDMSPVMKLLIGGAILIAAAFGLFLMIIGQVMLGINALAGLFGATGFLGLLKTIGAFIAGLGATFLWVLGIIIAVAIGIWLAWKSNFLNIRKDIKAFWEYIKKSFGGFITLVKGVLNVVKGIFMGDFTLIKKGVIQIFKGLINFLVNAFIALGAAVVIIFKGVVKLIWNVFKVLIDAILWAADKVAGFFGGSVKVRMPSFQTGGIVQATGPAFLHKGERVIPKGRTTSGEVTFAPSVVVNATINNDMDVRILANKLNEYWLKDFERIQGRI